MQAAEYPGVTWRIPTTMSVLDILRGEPDSRAYAKGETVFSRGDAADCLFVVIEGAADVLIDGVVVERVGSGGVFGEMALIDGQPRSATVVAATDLSLAAIGEKRFLRLVSQLPTFALQMMRVMTERLRRRGEH